MIRVRVELVPFGNESQARQIASMVVANDGSGDSEWGNYVYAYNDTLSKSVISGVVRDHYRSMGLWTLLKRVLNSSNEYDDTDKELIDLVVERLNADI